MGYLKIPNLYKEQDILLFKEPGSFPRKLCKTIRHGEIKIPVP